jgi:ORMDL family
MAQGNLVSSPLRGRTIETDSEGLCLRTRAKTPPMTPPRLSHSDDDSTSSGPVRPRLNSRDYVHSYDGAYGDGNDMTGFDLAVRNGGSWWEHQQWFMFVAYVIVLTIVWVYTTMTVMLSWTVTNVLHFSVTLIYLHWMKGGTHEDQGDLDHLTLWEQIEATPHTGSLRLALRLVPTFVCYMACREAGFSEGPILCALNLAVWYLTLLGKMPWMNGVRIFGINSHITDKERISDTKDGKKSN